MVEHKTFNLAVDGSSPFTFTIQKAGQVMNKSKEESIYAAGNPYGFRYNINHPYINKLYRRYKVWKDIKGRPPRDAERREFEKYLDKLFAGSESTPPIP